jgi:predicted nucleic acid-binding protein
MTGGKKFLDTNVIIYAYDASAGAKREKAKKSFSIFGSPNRDF